MLEMMRSHKFFSVFLLTAVTIMIIITFVFWGIGPKDNPSTGILARVEGERISLGEFWRAYDNEYERLKGTYSNEDEIKKLNIKDRVLDALVDRKVIIITAQKAGIVITENELQDVVMDNPYFQRDGVFDPDIYTKALRLNRLTPQLFEEGLKNDLIYDKMNRLIGETAELSSEDKKILEQLKGNRDRLTEIFRATKSNQAIKAYVEGLKRQMKIKIDRDLIS